MKKPADLCAYLRRTVAQIAANPQQVKTFVENGNIVSRSGGQSLSFEYRYTLRLVVLDFSGSLDLLAIPLLAWLATHQPDLLQNKEKSARDLRFEAEPLSSDKTDIVVEIELTEAVIVTEDRDAAGRQRLHAHHKGETLHPAPYASGDYSLHLGDKIGQEWHIAQEPCHE